MSRSSRLHFSAFLLTLLGAFIASTFALLAQIDGLPKSFVFDRDGKLVAQSIDMRTRSQFLEMLAQAKLQ